jgi:hypothetical protein
MPDSVNLTVHSQNTVADYSASQKVLCREVRSKTWLWLLLMVGLAFFVMFLIQAALLIFWKVSEEISVWIAIPVGLYVYLRAAFYFNRSRLKNHLHPGGPFLTPTDFTVAPDGLFFRSDRGEGRLAWHAFLRIEETATHLYFFVDKAMAQVIPKRCFPSEAAASEFVASAKRYFAAAHPNGH